MSRDTPSLYPGSNVLRHPAPPPLKPQRLKVSWHTAPLLNPEVEMKILLFTPFYIQWLKVWWQSPFKFRGWKSRDTPPLNPRLNLSDTFICVIDPTWWIPFKKILLTHRLQVWWIINPLTHLFLFFFFLFLYFFFLMYLWLINYFTL